MRFDEQSGVALNLQMLPKPMTPHQACRYAFSEKANTNEIRALNLTEWGRGDGWC